MALNRELKIALLKEKVAFLQNAQAVLAELQQWDAQASILPVEAAVASKTLIGKLWHFLPDEPESYQYHSAGQLLQQGKEMLPPAPFNQPVTLHLGWDMMSFSCSFEAAWYGWETFHTYNTDTFNACFYPQHLDWYIIRAGYHFYPMHLGAGTYKMIK